MYKGGISLAFLTTVDEAHTILQHTRPIVLDPTYFFRQSSSSNKASTNFFMYFLHYGTYLLFVDTSQHWGGYTHLVQLINYHEVLGGYILDVSRLGLFFGSLSWVKYFIIGVIQLFLFSNIITSSASVLGTSKVS